MNKVEEFLAAYREYESLLRDNQKDYKTIEDGSDDLNQNRMRICRQMRNYLSHQNDIGFLEPTKLQIDYMKELSVKQRLQMDTLEKHLLSVRAGSCGPQDTCEAVLRKMMKLKTYELPVYDAKKKALLGIVTLPDLALWGYKRAGVMNPMIEDIPKLHSDLCIQKPDAMMPDILALVNQFPVVCCTSDGTLDGKFLGVYITENGCWSK